MKGGSWAKMGIGQVVGPTRPWSSIGSLEWYSPSSGPSSMNSLPITDAVRACLPSKSRITKSSLLTMSAPPVSSSSVNTYAAPGCSIVTV